MVGFGVKCPLYVISLRRSSLPLLVFSKIFLFFSEVCFPQFTFAMTALVIEIHDCLTLCWMFRFYAVLRWKKRLEKLPKLEILEWSGRSPGPDEKFRTARAHAISQSDSIRIPNRWEAGKLYFFYLPSVLVSLFFWYFFKFLIGQWSICCHSTAEKNCK